MTLSSKPALPQGFITKSETFTTAVTNPAALNVSGVKEVADGGVNGAEITDIWWRPSATCTANALGLWASVAPHTDKYNVMRKTAGAQTVDATNGGTEVDFGFTADKPLKLGPGEKLWAGILTANPTTTGWQIRLGGRVY